MTLDEFIQAVRDMRKWQERFYRAKPGSQEKLDFRSRAKEMERKVDEHLAEMENLP